MAYVIIMIEYAVALRTSLSIVDCILLTKGVVIMFNNNITGIVASWEVRTK